MFTADIKGLKELNKNLKRLDSRSTKNVLRAALRAGGRVVVKEARNKLPSEYDTLQRALTLKLQRQRSPVEMKLNVGLTMGSGARYDGWYGHIVEFGAAPHDIPASGSKLMNIGDGQVATKVRHPGVKKRPFLRPAFEQNILKIQKVFISKLWTGIKKKMIK